MRKGHLKLIEEAKNRGFTEKELALVKSADYTLQAIKTLVRIITYINSHYDNADEMVEVCATCATSVFNGIYIEYVLEFIELAIKECPTIGDIQQSLEIIEKSASEDKLHPYDALIIFPAIVYMHQNCFDASKIDYILNAKLLDYSDRCSLVVTNSLIKVLKSCVGEEFYHNDNSFLEWFLSQNKKIQALFYASKAFDTWYDKEKHKFTLDVKQFCYIENREVWVSKEKLLSYRLSEDTLYSNLHKYITGTFNASQVPDPYEDLCYIKTCYFEPDVEKKLHNAYDVLQSRIIAQKSFNEIETQFTEAGYIYLTIKNGDMVEVTRCQDKIQIMPSVNKTFELMITPDENLFIRVRKNHHTRFIPLGISQFHFFLTKNTTGLHDLFDFLLSWYSKKSMLPQEVLHDLDAASEIRVPFSFNNLVRYYNKKQFIEANFKTSVQIPVNWNKRNIVLSWLMIHSWNMLSDDRSRQILMQVVDESILRDDEDGVSLQWRGSLKRGLYVVFLSRVIASRIDAILKAKIARQYKLHEHEIQARAKLLHVVATGVLEDETTEFLNDTGINLGTVSQVAYDYVSMCRQKNRRNVCGKVNLDIKSYAQLQNRHDGFNRKDHTYYEDHTAQVHVPKDSKFVKLREYLPEEFEWITDRKRLILETELQHHCVWSYADSITKDKCAIYSYVDKSEQFNNEPKRYTIEFRWDNTNKEYYVVQVQGRYNRVNANNMKEYIQVLLDGYQSKKKAV